MKLKLDDFLAKQPELAPDRREEFQWLFRELPEERSRILDAACGGNWLQFHLEQAGHESHSVDFDPAAATFNDLTPRPNFTLSNLLDPLPYADEFFDHILLISTTEHIESPTDDGDTVAVTNLARCLKKGGSLIVSFPFNHDGWQYAGTNYERHYTEESVVRRLAAPAGLTVDKYEVFSKEKLTWPHKDVAIYKLRK